jgi:PAS domain-containing protein
MARLIWDSDSKTRWGDDGLMTSYDLILAAAAGAVCLAICVTLWSLGQRRGFEARIAALKTRLIEQGGDVVDAPAWVEAFDTAVIAVEAGRASLVAGGESLAACAQVLGVSADVQAVVAALGGADPDHAHKLTALFETGEPCAFEARGANGWLTVEGRAAGSLAWLRLAAGSGGESGLPSANRFAALVDSVVEPCWIAGADGQAVWGNSAFVRAVGAASASAPALDGKSFDRSADAMVVEAVEKGERREALRWINLEGRRRAFRLSAQPLEGGGVGVFCADVTEIEDVRDAFKKHVEAHDETLNHIAEAVAIFSQTRRLSYHNTAFAELWGLERAWLDERPTHGEVLDRLRQRRRLPETIDYAVWKAAELARYEDLGPQADDLWHLPDARTLKVVRQPHPLGGMLLIYSDITGELRLKAQYNALIQVQQATLDKLNDAVAVFGSDGRLRLHNEAFETFWNVSAFALEAAGDFEGVVELCVPRLHDLAFWRELKGRVADPDPQMRAPTSGEVRTSDGRIVVYQSRPLPDGATLIAFADVTDTRDLQSALADRSAALAEAERLKRDFVGNVSLRAAHAADDDHRLFRASGTGRRHFRTRPQPCGRRPRRRHPAGPLDRRRAGHGPDRRRRDGAGDRGHPRLRPAAQRPGARPEGRPAGRGHPGRRMRGRGRADPGRRQAPDPDAGPPGRERPAPDPAGRPRHPVGAAGAGRGAAGRLRHRAAACRSTSRPTSSTASSAAIAAALAWAWPWSRRWSSCTAAGWRWRASRARVRPSPATCPRPSSPAPCSRS